MRAGAERAELTVVAAAQAELHAARAELENLKIPL
jgi:hypothetical protein